jgi:elongation factor Ts
MSQPINAEMVRTLREQTGAGIMDCKQALTEAGGDFDQARDVLRTKGLASAEKRKGRATREGLVDSYIHTGGRIGVLIEVNCETDFVARTDEFKALVHDLALQVATLSPRWVSREDVPDSELEREKAIYRDQVLAEGKGEDRLEQIVSGRLRKFYEAFCLLDQAWLRDEGSKARRVDEVIKATVAATGENISVARFIRYQLGEQLDAGEPDGA